MQTFYKKENDVIQNKFSNQKILGIKINIWFLVVNKCLVQIPFVWITLKVLLNSFGIFFNLNRTLIISNKKTHKKDQLFEHS